MSHEARPISPARFASALEDLPIANLYSKAFEINNSISHLQRSNDELQAYSDTQPGGDSDCLEAVRENEVVMGRMRDRVQMVKREVERRGGVWHEADVDSGEAREVNQNGHSNGDIDINGEELTRAVTSTEIRQAEGNEAAGTRSGGRLNDEELQRQLLERMSEDQDEGMHL